MLAVANGAKCELAGVRVVLVVLSGENYGVQKAYMAKVVAIIEPFLSNFVPVLLDSNGLSD